MRSDPDHEVEKAAERADASVDRLDRWTDDLGEHIDRARDRLKDMRRATGEGEGGEVAGDWRDTDDATGGEGPKGAARADDEASRGGVRRG